MTVQVYSNATGKMEPCTNDTQYAKHPLGRWADIDQLLLAADGEHLCIDEHGNKCIKVVVNAERILDDYLGVRRWNTDPKRFYEHTSRLDPMKDSSSPERIAKVDMYMRRAEQGLSLFSDETCEYESN